MGDILNTLPRSFFVLISVALAAKFEVVLNNKNKKGSLKVLKSRAQNAIRIKKLNINNTKVNLVSTVLFKYFILTFDFIL